MPPPSPPANDDFDAATAIVTLPARLGANTHGATIEPDEETSVPARTCGGPSGTLANSVWYTFTPTTTREVAITTDSSTFDTVLKVHTGGPLGSPTAIACNDDGGSPGAARVASRVLFVARAGAPRWIQVGGLVGAAYGEAGELVLEVVQLPTPITRAG